MRTLTQAQSPRQRRAQPPRNHVHVVEAACSALRIAHGIVNTKDAHVFKRLPHLTQVPSPHLRTTSPTTSGGDVRGIRVTCKGSVGQGGAHRCPLPRCGTAGQRCGLGVSNHIRLHAGDVPRGRNDIPFPCLRPLTLVSVPCDHPRCSATTKSRCSPCSGLPMPRPSVALGQHLPRRPPCLCARATWWLPSRSGRRGDTLWCSCTVVPHNDASC